MLVEDAIVTILIARYKNYFHLIFGDVYKRQGVLDAMPFLYPLLSWARGMEFPMMPTTVMPCSVAVSYTHLDVYKRQNL